MYNQNVPYFDIVFTKIESEGFVNSNFNKIRKIALRLAYNDETFLVFDDLSKGDKAVSIHKKIYKSLRQRSIRQKMI